MATSDSTQEIRRLLEEGSIDRLRSLISTTHPASLAEAINDLESDEIVTVVRHAPREVCSEIIHHLEPAAQIRVAELCHHEEIADLLAEMAPDDRVDLYKQMSRELQHEVLPEMPPDRREEMLDLASYQEETAGSLMTSEYVTLDASESVAEAIDSVREQAHRAETIHYAYVTDEAHRIEGVVSLRQLILADPSERISEIMRRDILQINVLEDQEEVVRRIRQANLHALPVVDDAGRIVGIITTDDAMDVHEEEATEDFQRMAPVALMETSLREASVWLLYRVRIPWLLVLVFMNVFSGAAIERFEETIAAYVALVFFLPLLIDSGGNAGSQAATLVVRALGTGDVRSGDWPRLLMRELGVIIPMGVTMALGVALIAWFRAPEVLLPVSLAMIAVVVYGSLIGVLLPFILTRLRMDPAAASAPLITSLADIGGVIIYFSVASWYLGIG